MKKIECSYCGTFGKKHKACKACGAPLPKIKSEKKIEQEKLHAAWDEHHEKRWGKEAMAKNAKEEKVIALILVGIWVIALLPVLLCACQ